VRSDDLSDATHQTRVRDWQSDKGDGAVKNLNHITQQNASSSEELAAKTAAKGAATKLSKAVT
jgi:hypothetical protein